MTRDVERVCPRLVRAQNHHDLFNALVNQAFADEKGIRREINDDGSEHTYYAVVRPGLVETFSLLVSDCLHSLRSALDNLVYLLAETHVNQSGMVLLPEDGARLAFPICDSVEAFADAQRKHRLNHLEPSEIQVIERHQPYNNQPFGMLDSGLRKLRELQNVDKHRFLIRLAVRRDNYFTHVPPPTGDVKWRLLTQWTSGIAIEDGSPLIEFTLTPPDPLFDLEYDPR